jgi:catechol-2,3-dioxygenase
MNLPDAPITHEGFFATHFFTVRDQEKSKDFYVRILGRESHQAGKSLLHQAG